MKWFTSLFCVLCLTFTLTGCGGDADAKKDPKKVEKKVDDKKEMSDDKDSTTDEN